MEALERALDENRRLNDVLRSYVLAPQDYLASIAQAAARQQEEFLKAIQIPDAVPELARQYAEFHKRTDFLSELQQLDALAQGPIQIRSALEEIARIQADLSRLGFAIRPPRRSARKRKAKAASTRGGKSYAQLARELFFGIIFPLIVALENTAERKEMEQGLSNKIDALDAKIHQQRPRDEQADVRQRRMEALLVQAIVMLQRIEASQVQMEVREPSTPIRRSPAKEAHVVARLPTGSTVELLDARDQWIKVRYVDSEISEPREGWALRRYFRRVSPTASRSKD